MRRRWSASGGAVGFSHSAARWPARAFDRFLSRIAHEIGCSLERLVGSPDFQGGSLQDPLVPLLMLSGEAEQLEPEHALQAAARLTELAAGWSARDADRGRTFELIAALMRAAQQGQPFQILPGTSRE